MAISKPAILMVDDRPENLLALESLLADFELHTVRATSGEAALKCLLDQPFLAILLDVQMPGMDGFELARTIRQREQLNDTPIVFITALSKEQIDEREGYSLGAINFLFKPIEPDILRATVRRLVQQSQQIKERDLSIETYHSIVEKNVDGLIVVDEAGIIQFVNPAVAAMLQQQPEKMIGSSFGLPVVSGDMTEIDICRHNSETGTGELRVVDTTWQGSQAYLIMLRDVTEQAQTKRDRLRLLDELKRSNQELEQFAYSVSHDLQSPLRGVVSFCQFLAQDYQGKLDERADGFIANIVNSAKRMGATIDALLDFSRVRKDDEPPEPADFNATFERAVGNLRVDIDESGATVTCDRLPTIPANAIHMTQLFQNLIGNAIKYRGDAPPQVHVAATEQNNCWQFTVRDDGIGIDSEHFDAVFKVFRRLHGRNEYSGTGIGLAICKKIIEQHGGRIWVESEPGQGSEFSFTIEKK